jgi:tyrosine decarboxylase / aspartate 1-decarboxylase
MTLEIESTTLLRETLEKLEQGFQGLPRFEPAADLNAYRDILLQVAEKMQDNYPYPHPFYVGQMLKPPHPIARLAYMLALWVNPNNHALDGGRASSAMEKEAVAAIANMFGWDKHLGHLTSGGTFANLEALWISGCLRPDKKIVASQQAHYTHQRICGVLKIPFDAIPCDSAARMDVTALKRALEKGDVGTVVVTVGTTATGSVDPLLAVLELQEDYDFRIHVDAAYGGYYVLADNLREHAAAVYQHLSEADSLVVDPHKHGLQPYGCGCVVFKDPSVGRFYKHDSPYTYFTSTELHLGEISLECSRAGASAVALWATQRMLPPVRGGEFARGLEKCRGAAVRLFELLAADDRFLTALAPELDIVVWAVKAPTASESSLKASALFDAAADQGLHLAKANLPRSLFEQHWPGFTWDQDYVTCLRTCLMKPEHLEWMDRIWEKIDAATTHADLLSK